MVSGLEGQPQVTAVDIGMLASMLMVDFSDVRFMIGDNFGDFLELAGLIDEYERLNFNQIFRIQYFIVYIQNRF